MFWSEPDEEEEALLCSPALMARRASESWIVAPPVEVRSTRKTFQTLLTTPSSKHRTYKSSIFAPNSPNTDQSCLSPENSNPLRNPSASEMHNKLSRIRKFGKPENQHETFFEKTASSRVPGRRKASAVWGATRITSGDKKQFSSRITA